MHRVVRRPIGIALVFAAALTLFVACGNGQPGPTAHPDRVVRTAPDLTVATGSARVVGAAPGVTATGTIVFASGKASLTFAPPPTSEPPFGVREPGAALDLLRGVTHVRSYGGAEVQGVGTKRYEVDIDLAKAIAATPVTRRDDLHRLDGKLGKDRELWADVFVDAAGRVRRILLPVRTSMIRPYGQDQKIPALVSVDYSHFGAAK